MCSKSVSAQEPEPPGEEIGADVVGGATGEPESPEGEVGAKAEVPRDLMSFDSDNYADLAIGVPYEDVTTIVDAGAVNVIYGT
ncbi:MAG: hypothetical protein JXR84_27435, partial [Anaerolineae bacterium]|nr:hypothetical protein [Anaerolineae bacterium]